MIQTGTFLSVIDNSGAKQVLCLKVLKGYNRRYAFIGDVILVSIKKLRAKRKSFSKVKKGELVRAIVVRTKTKLSHLNTDNVSFLSNSVILVSKQNKLIGTRIFGSIPAFFRNGKLMKYLTLASGGVS